VSSNFVIVLPFLLGPFKLFFLIEVVKIENPLKQKQKQEKPCFLLSESL